MAVWTLGFALLAAHRIQDPAPPIDPTPLARPVPLARLACTEPVALFAEIERVVREAGFQVDTRDAREHSIDATRPAPPPASATDRILLWLERDYQEPLRFIEIYLLYGRFQEVWGRERKIVRVQVDASHEDRCLRPLKNALSALGSVEPASGPVPR